MVQAPLLQLQIPTVYHSRNSKIDALHATSLRSTLLNYDSSAVNHMEDIIPVSVKLHGADYQQE